MVIDSIPILFSERGTWHDRTQDETQSNAGRDAIERRTAFAKKYRDWILCLPSVVVEPRGEVRLCAGVRFHSVILSKKRPTTNAFVLAYVAVCFVFCQSVGRMVPAFQMKEGIRNKS